MRRRVLVAIAVTAGILLCVMLVHRVYTSASTKFYAKELASYRSNSRVSVDDSTYTMIDGAIYPDPSDRAAHEALRLSYAQVVTRYNPLFALPGTDPERLEYAAKELHDLALALSEKQKDPKQRAYVRENLYPVEFLEAAARTERARTYFLEDGSQASLRLYQAAVNDTARAYLASLVRFRRAASASIENLDTEYIAAGNLISKGGILRAIESLERGAQSTLAAFRRRELCLYGYFFLCRAGDLAPQMIPTYTEAPLLEVEISAAHEMQSLLSPTEKYRSGPLVLTQESSCAKDSPGKPIFAVAPSAIREGASFARERALYVGDLRFIRLADYDEMPFYQDLRARGMRYVLSPPLLHYECVGHGTDYAAIFFTLRALSSTSPEVYYQSEAIKSANEKTISGEDPDLGLSMLYNSAGKEQTILDIVWAERTNLQLIDQGISAALNANNLFFSRSAFASLFMADNVSFVGDVTLFETLTLSPDQVPYQYLSEVPAGSVREKVIDDIRQYILLHYKARWI